MGLSLQKGSDAMLYHLRVPRLLAARMASCGRRLSMSEHDALPQMAQWLLDNMRWLLSNVTRLQTEAALLPALPSVGGRARVLVCAQALCEQTGGDIKEKTVRAALTDWQRDGSFTQEELSAVPAALRIALYALISGQLTLVNRLADASRKAEKLAARLVFGRTDVRLPRDAAVLEQTIALLQGNQERDALRALDGLLEKRGTSAERIVQEMQAQHASGLLLVSNVITSLRALSRMPFGRMLARANAVYAVLAREDTFLHMDDDSRALYAWRVAALAKRLKKSEVEVALAAIAAPCATGECLLIDETPIRKAFGMKPGVRAYVKKRARTLYCLALYALDAVFLTLALLSWLPPALIPVYLFVSAAVARSILQFAVRKLLPPRRLPRLDIRHVPKDLRVLVVVPTLLCSRAQAIKSVSRLSALQDANSDARIDYLLLADFCDSDTQAMPEDQLIVSAASQATDALCQAKPGRRFMYIQRERAFCQSEKRYMGRERKRGALQALNRMIAGEDTGEDFLYASRDAAFFCQRYAYVVTLDSDTVAPPHSVMKLVCTMLHPLQRGRVTLLQPVMSSLLSMTRTRIQKFMGTGGGGPDAYNSAVCECYQDACARGSFCGKGIYEPVAFLRATHAHLPSGRILSHDLIEGELCQSALCDDVTLYDAHPRTLAGYLKRLHRWTRGDWQLVSFLADRSLPLLSRHKIWDNLFRSLLPLAQIAALFVAVSAGLWGFGLLALYTLFRPYLAHLLLLPARALTQADAALRALYRMCFSKPGLLEWSTAAQEEQGDKPTLLPQFFSVLCGAGLLICAFSGGVLWMGVPVGLLWTVMPLTVSYLDGALYQKPRVDEDTRLTLLHMARSTFAFFQHTVTKETNHLPPDNLQIEPDTGVAVRTSPTNIGLYMLSCLASRHLGFIDSDEMARLLALTTDTLEKLDKWNGHLYNWYQTDTLAVLSPRYVSGVDSGNLCACLLACAQGCRALMTEMDASCRALPARLDRLARNMRLDLLYDKQRELFYIGYNADSKRFSGEHYDLLASEARLLSYLCVMSGQAPVRHWYMLGRRVVRTPGGPTLLSWGGTMFEYLLPTLLLRAPEESLLHSACQNAVRAQRMAYRTHPWGVSESGYAAFDPSLQYQYRAFGLPKLALSGDTGGDVITPYASALALPFYPREAADNLRYLRDIGMLGELGFYEAVDYRPYSMGTPPRVVFSHMAHHQGMILCAICNHLCDDALVRAFSSLPIVRAYNTLLDERAQKHADIIPDAMLSRPVRYADNSPRRVAGEGFPQDTAVILGADTTLVITRGGSGFMASGDVLWTRFLGDSGAIEGLQLYLRDDASGAYTRLFDHARAVFFGGAAQFSGQFRDLKYACTACVSPLSGACVYDVTVEAADKRERRFSLCSYLEPSLLNRAADRSHPAFYNLFVETLSPDAQTVLARRRPRGKERGMTLAHFLRASHRPVTCVPQGDRQLFLGRNGSVSRPEQLRVGAEHADARLGDTLAPCLSLYAQFQLPPGEKLRAVFFTAARETADDALSVKLSHPDAQSANQALRLALARDAATRRFLHIGDRTFAMLGRLSGRLLFAGQPRMPALFGKHLTDLWALGISGDIPLAVCALTSYDHLAALRQMLLAHAWLRMQGIQTDLAVICAREAGYRRYLYDAAMDMAQSDACRDMLQKPGGVWLLDAPDEDAERTLRDFASLFIEGGLPVAAQLENLTVVPPEARLRAPTEYGASRTRSHVLLLDNGTGGFERDGRYVITLIKDAATPAPWCNLLCSQRLGTLCCEQGVLFTYLDNSRLSRLTAYTNDSVLTPVSEGYFLRAGDTVYSLTRRPFAAGDAAVTHGAGETRYDVALPFGSAALHCFTLPDAPCGMRLLEITADSDCEVALVCAVRFAPGQAPRQTTLACDGDTVTAVNPDISEPVHAYLDGARTRAQTEGIYFGLHGAPVPEGLRSDAEDDARGTVGLLEKRLSLRAGQACRECLLLYVGEKPDTAPEEALARTRAHWRWELSGVQIKTRDDALRLMMNLWLPYQTRASRLLARTGFYQPGGAYGFRDQLQDMLGLLYTHPERVRAHLLLCAEHQFTEGDVQHWWHAPNLGVRTRITDDMLFLPFVTARYVLASGDTGVLQVKAAYLTAPPLEQGEHDRYFAPAVSQKRESLYQHCLRAIDCVRLGEHGLPLMGGGDWNDGMNEVGGARGESVWLGMFYIVVLRMFEPYCEPSDRERLEGARKRMWLCMDHAWTGDWFLRAWYDDGRTLGAPDSDVPRIDLICQCWAVLSELPPERAKRALENAWSLLYDPRHRMLRLLWPPFSPREKAGYIASYALGVRENGGQYTHAVAWMIEAFIKLGDYDRAWTLLSGALPCAHADSPDAVARYRVEPYVVAADIYSSQTQEGRGGWTWYTGSAALLYDVALTKFLGFDKRGDTVWLTPHVPRGFGAYRVEYRHHSALYRLIADEQTSAPQLDGAPIMTERITLLDDGRTHEARFPLYST